MIYIIETYPSNQEEHVKESKVVLLENIKPSEMDDGERKTLYLDANKSELVFSFPNNFNILEKIKFQFKEELTLSFIFKSFKKQIEFKNIKNVIDIIRNENEGKKLKLYISCNLLFDNDSKLDCKNIIEIKINDVLYCFSKLNLNDFFYENKSINSLIFQNFKINSNQQIKNFFGFLENLNDNLQSLEIENLSLEILDDKNQQLFYYMKIKNNQVILVNKEIGQEKVLNIKNLILKNSTLCIIDGDDENIFDNDIHISINQISLLVINYCGIINYEYKKDEKFSFHFDYNYLEKNLLNEMDIENEKDDGNKQKKKFNKIENFQHLISNKNFKCNYLKLSNFKEPIEIEIGCPELISEIYFDNCSSELTNKIIDKCPNLTKLKLKGINDKNNIHIPQSIVDLNIRDSYIETSSTMTNLSNLTISLYYLEENKELYEQKEQYNKTIDTLKKILNEKNNIKIITFKGNAVSIKLENENFITNSIINYGNCEIKSFLFQKFQKENEIELHNCTLEKTENIDWKFPFKKITFDFNTFNEIIFQVNKNDINDIDEFIKNIAINEDKNLKEKFGVVKKRMMDVFNGNNFKIVTKNDDLFRKVVLTFFIFKNEQFKTYEELLQNYQKHLENNYYIIKEKKNKDDSIIKIPILMNDYLTNEQIEFVKNMKDIEIILN